MDWIDIALVIQVFALLNPLSSFPFLIAAYQKKMNVKAIAVKSVIVAFIIAVVIALLGMQLFNVFGIDVSSFRVAGGIILLLLAINMVRPKENGFQVEKITSLITIIATPMLTGPGTISFITIKVYEIGTAAMLLNLCVAFVLVAIVFILFSFAVDRINITLVDILSRILGLFLAAVAIQMISKGIEGIIVSFMSAA